MLKTMACIAALAAVSMGSAPPAAAAMSPAALGVAASSNGVTAARYRHGHLQIRRYYRPAPRVLLYAGPPVVGYGGRCAWLHAKARNTGSTYWWRRYRSEC